MADRNRILVDTQQLSKSPRDICGELAASIFGLSPVDRFKCNEPLVYNLRGALVGEGFLIEGSAESTVHCSCDRCLSEYDQLIKVASVCHFYEGLDHRVIDITDDIREDVVINFPDRCLCNEKCKGLCPQCGQNLNEASCECTGKDNLPSAWDKLDGLKL